MTGIPSKLEKTVHIPSLIIIWDQHKHRINNGGFFKEKANKACALLKGLPIDKGNGDVFLEIDTKGNPDNDLTALFFSRADKEHGALSLVTNHIKKFPFEYHPENFLRTINNIAPEPSCILADTALIIWTP